MFKDKIHSSPKFPKTSHQKGRTSKTPPKKAQLESEPTNYPLVFQVLEKLLVSSDPQGSPWK